MTNYWVFPFIDGVSDNIKKEILKDVNFFLSTWESHGAKLDACADIFFSKILVIYLVTQEDTGSGCSIDLLKNSVHQILDRLKITILNSNFVIIKQGEMLEYIKRNDISEEYIRQIISSNYKILDLSRKFEPKLGFEKLFIPVRDSWINYSINLYYS